MVWQISRSYKVPLPEQLEEEVGIYGAKQGVQAEIHQEHFVDPSQGFHPEQTRKRCLSMFDDGEYMSA